MINTRTSQQACSGVSLTSSDMDPMVKFMFVHKDILHIDETLTAFIIYVREDPEICDR